MTITDQTTVAELAATVPSSVRVFQRYGIDFCCGGKRPLAVVCEEQGLSFADVAGAIAAASPTPADTRDWARERLGTLIAHIVTAFHNPLREELPRLETMAARVAQVHGAHDGDLHRVEQIVAALADDLVGHMAKEEAVVFPAIEALERGALDRAAVSAPIEALEGEHDAAGSLLSELRAITGGYATPDWACQTFRSLYHGLAELERTMHLHVHLENNVLFPRALGDTGPSRAGA